MTRAIPQAAIDFIKAREALRLVGYPDTRGTPTWGYGHTGPEVVTGQSITLDQAEADLEADLTIAAQRLSSRVDASVIDALTDNQYAALISFVFNTGAGNWQIWKILNARQFDQVPMQLMRFTYSGEPPNAVKVQGLVNRRADEVRLWSTDEPGSIPIALPSSVTRATATPAVPLDPAPRGIRLIAGVATTAVAGAIPQAQGALQAVKDAITPYEDASHIIGHLLSLVGVTCAALAVAALGVKYLKDRQAKSWSKSAAPALHPTILENAMNPNPPPGGTIPTSTGSTMPPITPLEPVVPSGAGTTAAPIPSELTTIRDTLGRCLAKLGGDVEAFAGKTVSEIVAEAKKLAAAVESKL